MHDGTILQQKVAVPRVVFQENTLDALREALEYTTGAPVETLELRLVTEVRHFFQLLGGE